MKLKGNNVVMITVPIVFAFTICCRLPSIAQTPDAEARKQQVTQAKQIIQRMRSGEWPSEADLDLLDDLVSHLRPTEPPGPTNSGAAKPASPTPDKHETTSRRPLAPVFSKHSTKDGVVYTYEVDLKANTLRTFWMDKKKRPYGSILRLQEDQNREGNDLQFAINGAIFDERFHPKGLYIEEGEVLSQLDVTQPGPNAGNFYAVPNGVFFVDSEGVPRILTTQRFTERFPKWWNEKFQAAVQSGPVLLIDGKINPQFAEESINRKRRSGVGVLGDGRVVFAISGGDISFREFAAIFEQLDCRDALYLDGGPIGSLYVKHIFETGYESPLVTMIGVVEKVRKN